MRRPRSTVVRDLSAFAGFRFPPEVILLAVRWYLRYGPSYRDLEELLAERWVEVDHVTLFRWVQRFTPLLVEAARPCRHAVGGRWFVDETYVKVAGVWRYVYRAVDADGQILDVFVSRRRDAEAATWFFTNALRDHGEPDEVTTDCSPVLARVIDEIVPDAFHDTEQYANNRVECDHGRPKARLRPMSGLKTDRTASVIIGGHAFMQNLRRGHYELATAIRSTVKGFGPRRGTRSDNATAPLAEPRRTAAASRECFGGLTQFGRCPSKRGAVPLSP